VLGKVTVGLAKPGRRMEEMIPGNRLGNPKNRRKKNPASLGETGFIRNTFGGRA